MPVHFDEPVIVGSAPPVEQNLDDAEAVLNEVEQLAMAPLARDQRRFGVEHRA
jgi:hypothetical protein